LAAAAQMRATFSNPNVPGTLEVEIVSGSIAVIGGAGKDVVVDVKGGEARRERTAPQGMRRIGGGGSQIEVHEERNVVKVESDGMGHQDLEIQVPQRTSLKLETVNNGAIRIENVEGEIEAQNVNGHITLTNVSGTVIANTVNGKISMSLLKGSAKPMSLTTLNGAIDVTLPADLKATLKMRADNGDIYADFEMAVKNEQTQTKNKRGWSSETMTVGSINGGGPEIRLQTMNGKIYVRKK
jgi:hypothetical protein